MEAADPVYVLEEIVIAFNVADWRRLRAAVADDLVYREIGAGRCAEGGDAYVELCKGWREAFPDAYGTVERSIADGESGALELRWTGTHDGPLDAMTVRIPASGRRVELHSSFWCRTEGGTAAEITHHIDMLGMLTQIGTIRGPSRGEELQSHAFGLNTPPRQTRH